MPLGSQCEGYKETEKSRGREPEADTKLHLYPIRPRRARAACNTGVRRPGLRLRSTGRRAEPPAIKMGQNSPLCVVLD